MDAGIVDGAKTGSEKFGVYDVGDGLGGVDIGEDLGLLESVIVCGAGDGGGGILGNFRDHFGGGQAEADLVSIFRGDEESAQDEAGAADIDVVADEGVDDFHERGLDGMRVFEHGDGMETRLGRGADAADEALVKITKNFLAQGGGAATDSVDLDVGAGAGILGDCHGLYAFRFFWPQAWWGAVFWA